MKKRNTGRRDFIKEAIVTSGVILARSVIGESCDSAISTVAAKDVAAEMVPMRRRSEERQVELITKWDESTELVSSKVYNQYLHDGNTRGFKALDALEHAFDKVMREVKEATVAVDVPAVWSLYNMGYVVKTRESLFTIDIKHRRDSEFAKMVDFALVTHNHPDHLNLDYVQRVAGRGKPVVTNFLGYTGYTRAKKVFRFNDVEVRTSLIDHGGHLVDFTTAFEIRIGNFRLYHTGDSGRGTEPKLETVWGRPNLWLLFPGCGLNTLKAVEKIDANRIVFGHLWELGHAQGHRGRLDKPLILSRLAEAKKAGCKDISVAFWGDRII